MNIEGRGQIVGAMPTISAEGKVFSPTGVTGEVNQTLAALTHTATGKVTFPFVDEGNVLRLYGWTNNGQPRMGFGRTPAEARENLIIDLINGL